MTMRKTVGVVLVLIVVGVVWCTGVVWCSGNTAEFDLTEGKRLAASPDYHDRLMATGILKGNKEALPLLVPLLQDKERYVRWHAAITIVELTGASVPAPVDLDEQTKATWNTFGAAIKEGGIVVTGETAIAAMDRYVEALFVWCKGHLSMETTLTL
jgi:hypothetical protein